MDKDSLIVEGFVFPDEKEAEIARKEQNNIAVIRSRTELANPQTAYELYTKMIERNMFQTIVGYSFLYELRYHLIHDFNYSEDELLTIRIPKRMEYDRVHEWNQGRASKQLQDAMLTQKRMRIVILALSVMVVAMFVIAAVNPNTGYINTERKVLNKYAAWQEELEQREQAIKEKEKALQE